MAVTVIGQGPAADAVRAAMASSAGRWAWIGGGTGDFVMSQAKAALRHALPVLLSWPSDESAVEARRILQFAEEAGVDVSMSRPLRWTSLACDLYAAAPFDLVSIRAHLPAEGGPLDAGDLLDLGVWDRQVGGRCQVDRVGDCVAVQAAVQGGGMVQLSVVTQSEASIDVVATGRGGRRSHTATLPGIAEVAALCVRQAEAFDRALSRGAPIPAPLADGLSVVTLADRLRAPMSES